MLTCITTNNIIIIDGEVLTFQYVIESRSLFLRAVFYVLLAYLCVGFIIVLILTLPSCTFTAILGMHTLMSNQQYYEALASSTIVNKQGLNSM